MCWARTISIQFSSRRIRRSTAPTDPFLQRALSKYVTLSIDNLVSVKEQQFVDSVSHRADELKPLGHESLPLFTEHPFLFRTESEDSAV